jgi:hypothetical protein
MAGGIIAMEHDLITREASRPQMPHKLCSFTFAECAEDRRVREDARDRLGVHGADNTLALASGFETETSALPIGPEKNDRRLVRPFAKFPRSVA